MNILRYSSGLDDPSYVLKVVGTNYSRIYVSMMVGMNDDRPIVFIVYMEL